MFFFFFFFFSSRRRHTRFDCDWSSDVCSSDLGMGPTSKQLALTYDDGPNDPYTARLLEVLAKHDVRATFFLIGGFVRQRPDIVREVVQAGHIVGNHTFTHPALTFKRASEVTAQLNRCERALTEAVGQHSNL